MYTKIINALDGSFLSDLSMEAGLIIASRTDNAHLIGCHVYASRLHRTRFEEMEPGLPEQYQEEENLTYLRDTHEDLISEGLQLISDAYLAPFVEKANALDLSYSGLTPEGHHYVKLLEALREAAADLLILGAAGLGVIEEEPLGSLTERLLLYGEMCDILVIRQAWQFKNRPIVVGVDGSPNSYQALKRAVEMGQLMGAEVEAVAVYDPFFHSTVFQTIASSLTEETAEKFNFTAQEQLHDEIIDRGLETLYRDGLRRAMMMAEEMGCTIKTEAIAGKVYAQLHHYAALRNAGLVVVGRHGLHYEKESVIGSNTHKFARLTPFNLLVVRPAEDDLNIPELHKNEETTGLIWDAEAERILQRVPMFVRKMAKRSIEARAVEKGLGRVTVELVMQVSGKMGMDKK